jgi:hypothetical protein
MKNFIKEFISFLNARRDIALSGIMQEEDVITYMVNRYDIEKEKLINDIVINKLIKDLIKEGVSRDYFLWYKAALEYRVQIMRNNKHLKDTKHK